MQISWQPKFRVGDYVRVLPFRLPGRVTEIDLEQAAYVVDVKGNPEFRLLCTEDQLKVLPRRNRVAK